MSDYFGGSDQFYMPRGWAGNTPYDGRFTFARIKYRGTGMGVGWILLVDTLAGSIIVLSITGVLLWTQLNRRRLVGVALFSGSLLWMVVGILRAL